MENIAAKNNNSQAVHNFLLRPEKYTWAQLDRIHQLLLQEAPPNNQSACTAEGAVKFQEANVIFRSEGNRVKLLTPADLFVQEGVGSHGSGSFGSTRKSIIDVGGRPEMIREVMLKVEHTKLDQMQWERIFLQGGREPLERTERMDTKRELEMLICLEHDNIQVSVNQETRERN